MKGYRIKVVAQITLNVTEKDFIEDKCHLKFNKDTAVMYAKGALVERMRDIPYYGHVKVEEFEYEK